MPAAARPQIVAVLARVALAGRPVGRRELAGELFGEADDPLGALRWSLADLRRSFGPPSSLCGDPLGLSPGELWVDVRALEDGSLPVEDIGGGLLEGIELRNCPGSHMVAAGPPGLRSPGQAGASPAGAEPAGHRRGRGRDGGSGARGQAGPAR